MTKFLKIEKLVYGGLGMGRVEGKVVFVPFGLPGEELEVEIVRDLKGHAFGEIKKVLAPSPHRLEPDCSVFFRCGGCSHRHLDYGEELRWKGKIFEELLGALLKKDVETLVHGSSVTRFYRNRVDFHVKDGQIGFFQRNSHELIAVDSCPLAERPINHLLKKIILSGVLKKKGLPLPERLSLLAEGKRVFALLSFTEKKERDVSGALNAFRKLKGCAGVEREGQGVPKPQEGAAAPLSRRLAFFPPHAWEVSLQSFCQPNLAVNRKMLSLYIEEIKDSENILDLYAGSGNFSLPSVLQGKKATCVESNPFSIRDLQKVKNEQGLEPLQVVRSPVGDFLKRTREAGWDTVVADPPREGMREAVLPLAALGAKKIIYVSCDPATFVRDARVLVEKGYSLKRSHVLDMFPKTYHFESLHVFENSNSR